MFPNKKEQSKMPLGAVDQPMTSTERAVWGGKDGQHHNDCECPSQTRSTQHASFSNQRVMYSTTVTLFSQIDHYIQKPCAAAVVQTSRWDEKVHYSYITLAQMIFFFFSFANGNH